MATTTNAQETMSDQLIEPIITTGSDKPSQTNKSPSIWSTLKSCRLWILLFYGLLLALMNIMTGIVLPVIGSRFFEKNDPNIDGNSRYSFWSGISSSVGGLIGFLFEGYIGRLSDAYGRKKLMICMWFFYVLPGLALMVSSYNIWVYLSLAPLSSLSGAFGGMPTLLQAAISDIIPSKHITLVYMVGFGVAGLFMVVAAVLCSIVVTMYGIKTLWYIFLFGMLFNLIWLSLMVSETLPPEKRKSMKETADDTLSHKNPFKVFKKLKHNKVLFWLCMLALLTSFPENGISDFLTNYVDDILNTDGDDDKATFINSICEIVMAVTLIISQLIIVPILYKIFKSDTGLMCIGTFAELVFMFAGILLYLFRNIYTAFILWFVYGLTYIMVPVVNGALASRSNEKEQGVSIGILHAMKALTSAVAPFVFGVLYDLYNFTGDKYEWLKILPWLNGAGFVVIAYFILLGPLKRTLNEFDMKNKDRDYDDKLEIEPKQVVIN